MKYITNPSVRNDQKGLVSIVVTIVLMLVISLITLSFARVIQREQRQQTDRQLSSRAFYAAESGVNIAAKKLASTPSFTGNTAGCNDPALFAAGDLIIDAATGTEVTCVSVNQKVDSLFYSNIINNAKRIPLTADGGVNFSSIKFEWQSASSPGGSFAGCGTTNPQVAAWNCGAPLLRIDLAKVDGNISRDSNLLAGAQTFFLYPATSSSSSGPAVGQIIRGTCAAANTPDCSATFNIPAALQGPRYIIRVISMYGNSQLTIKGTNTSGTPVVFVGAQAVIDSTAKSQDVLRRLQVRRSIDTTDTPVPDAAIVAPGGVCKRYLVRPGIVEYDPASLSTDAACNLN